MAEIRASYPRFRRAEGPPPRIELTQDDIEILRVVHRYRFVRADDLYRLFPDRSSDRLSRRLTTLFRAGFLDRPLSQIDRFKRGGSQALVYGLDRLGAKFLKEEMGSSIGETNWKARNRAFKRENLDHTLATTSFLITVELECRATPGMSFIPFEHILAKAPEKTRRSAMPMRWLVPLRHNGSSADVMLAPDAIFGLRQSRENAKSLTSYFFLEVDRGTTTIVPAPHVREGDAFLHRTTILRKLLAYAENWSRAIHQEKFQVASARVLFLTNNSSRMHSIRMAARDFAVRPFRLPTELFLFGVTEASVNSRGFKIMDASGEMAPILPSGAHNSVGA